MQVGELYYLTRRLKAIAEQAIGAQPGQVDAVPVRDQLVLGAVLEAPGCSVGDIARSASIAQSAASAAVAALRESGLVVTAVDAKDGRVTRVHPSERLERWAGSHLSSTAEDVLAPLLAGMGSDDRSCVLRAMELLYQAVQRTEAGEAELSKKAGGSE
ncbi:MAG TPA: MarR family transcriptional regulator [Actinomycetota bacterium]|nr:MarR family transcriptional regulator [Actinomycetota bacterium]